MTPSAQMSGRRSFAVGLTCLLVAAAAYGTLHVTPGPKPVYIHVRWAPGVDDAIRQETAQRYSLSQGTLLEGRTWGYTLSDLSEENVSALVRDAAIEDTDEIDRSAFRVSPDAPRRPYSTTDTWKLRGLWTATVLCLAIGLIGISLGLVERFGARKAIALFDQQHTMRRRLSLLLVVTVMGACFLAARTMELRVDEQSHHAQILRYVSGNFVTTTTAAGGFEATASIFVWLTGRSAKEDIRLFVIFISGAAILLFRSLVQSFEPQAGNIRTLQFMFFPLLFPFWFLIYTDVYALMLLLLAVLALMRDRFHAAGILMTVSMMVRQSYVVWLALLGLWTVIGNVAEPLRRLTTRSASFGVGAGLFLLFVIANGGVAVGDRDRHPDFVFRVENLLFMLVCFFLMFLPLILSKLPQIARLHPALLVGVPLASVALFLGAFHVDHPYNIQDQSYYLRNAMLEVITSSPSVGVATGLAMALAVLSLCVIRLRRPIYYLIYLFAALSVIPMWLIEQRYYLPAFALFMLFRESASPRVERAIAATNVALALYLFAGVVRGEWFL